MSKLRADRVRGCRMAEPVEKRLGSYSPKSLLQKHGLEIIVALCFPVRDGPIDLGFFSASIRRRPWAAPAHSTLLHPETTLPTSPRSRLVGPSNRWLNLKRHCTLTVILRTIGSYPIMPHFFPLLQHFLHTPDPELTSGSDFVPVNSQRRFTCTGNVFVFNSRTAVIWTENDLYERTVLLRESCYSGVIYGIRYIEQRHCTGLYFIV